MKLFDVYATGIPKMTLAGTSKEDAHKVVFDYVKAFYPRREWKPENITVVELGRCSHECQ